MKLKSYKRQKGITLIALVVTIIILLILAGTTISLLFGENGVLSYVTMAKEQTEIVEEKELIKKVVIAAKISENGLIELNEENLQEQLKNEIGKENIEIFKTSKGLEVHFIKSDRYYLIKEDEEIEYEEYRNSIPENFQVTDYIENDGKQYIDTGFEPDQDTSIEFVAESLEGTPSVAAWFGARDSVNKPSYTFWQMNTGYRSDYSSTKTDISNFVFNSNTKYTIYKNKNITYIDGEKYVEANYEELQTTSTLTLFGVKTGSNVDDRISVLKLYACKIWDGDELVRDYIPVKDENNNQALYDIVNSEVYYFNSKS